MTTSAPLEVKVIFDASSRRGRKPARRAGHSSGVGRSSSRVLLGIINILAAAGLYYATWWRADPFIYLTMMLKTPDPTLPALASLFGSESANAPQQLEVVPLGVSRDAVVIGATAYSWLTFSTIAICAMALAAGAAMAQAAGPWRRRAGWIASFILLVALVVYAFTVWTNYGARYLPNHLRFGIGGLALFITALGFSIGRGALRLSRLAAYMQILAALVTAVALFLGAGAGAIEPQYATPLALAVAFTAHSACGWLSLAVAWRAAR